MKATVKLPQVINISHIRIELAVNYGEEDIPNDFPGRKGDIWTATVNIDTGEIVLWPKGKPFDLYMKVCDGGSYYLLDVNGKIIASRENNYVPHGVVPGEYGDYVDLKIDESGVITNWPKRPDVSAFFADQED